MWIEKKFRFELFLLAGLARRSWRSQRKLFGILLVQTEIRLYLPLSDCFGFKRTLIWFKINRKMVNTIRFQFELTSFQKDFSVYAAFQGNMVHWENLVKYGMVFGKIWYGKSLGAKNVHISYILIHNYISYILIIVI